MKIKDLIQESFADIGPAVLVIKTDSRGEQRLIDTNSRNIMGIVRSVADLSRLISPRNVHSRNIVIRIPPEVNSQNPDLIASIQKFAPSLGKTIGKSINVEIMGENKIKENNPGANVNTARSIGADIHSYVEDLGFHLSQHGQDQHALRLKQEIQSMIDDLAGIGYEYDPKSTGYIRPLTLSNKPQQKLGAR